jgi:hypothetical protein
VPEEPPGERPPAAPKSMSHAKDEENAPRRIFTVNRNAGALRSFGGRVQNCQMPATGARGLKWMTSRRGRPPRP